MSNDEDMLKIAETVEAALRRGDSAKVKTILDGLTPEDLKTLLHIEVSTPKYTLFTIACLFGNDKSAEMILDYAKDYETDLVNTQQVSNISPLFCVTWSRNTHLVSRLLMVPGIDVNVQNKGTGETPLIIAAKRGCYEIVLLLLNHPFTITNLKSRDNETALDVAIKNKHSEIVELLLSFSLSNLE